MTTPPLNAAIGSLSFSGSISMAMPFGGRPLVMANWIPASRSLKTDSNGALGEDFVVRHQRAVHVGDHESLLGGLACRFQEVCGIVEILRFRSSG